MTRDQARATLLAALDQLDQLHDELGEARSVQLACAYAYQTRDETMIGWTTTNHPSFSTAALLRTVANSLDHSSHNARDGD